MSRSPAAYLYDMQRAAAAIRTFSSGKTFADFNTDLLLRSAIERQFEIIGEALNKLGKLEPDLQARIRNHQDIIGFRNILVHGYASLDNAIVSDAVIHHVAEIHTDVAHVLAGYDDNA